MRILVTGGTGFIGNSLTKSLKDQGHEVVLLTRRDVPPPGADLPAEFLERVDAIVNMAGENIAGGRWTESNKRRIRHSRIHLTEALANACRAAAEKGLPVPGVMISFSAVGYYGTDPSAVFTEKSPPGAGWLPRVAQDWEAAASGAVTAGVRLVIFRLGVVLGPGGFLQRLAPPFRFFTGGPAGSGKQWISWIHRDDVVAVVINALTDERLKGPYNLTTPDPVTMDRMSAAIGMALERPSWLRIPGFVLRLLFGEMAEELILKGQRALPVRLSETGYRFLYPDLQAAVEAAFRDMN